MRLPDQSVGVPVTVTVKVSQFTPSTQVPSPLFVPPAAVPTHEIGAEFTEIVPVVGLAAPIRKTEIVHSKLITAKPTNNVQRFLLIPGPFSDLNRSRG